MSITKTRNYTALMYPESAKEHWQKIIENTHVKAFISPLHEYDIEDDPEDENFGNPKKPHYHVIMMYDGPKTYKSVNKFFESIGGTKCRVIDSLNGMVRYMCHLDNKDKHKYDESDVISLNGADYDVLSIRETNQYEIIEQIIKYCENNNVRNFYLLCRYATSEKKEWLKVIVNNAFFIKEILKSCTISPETGEFYKGK